MRRIEALEAKVQEKNEVLAELMIAAHNFTASYAKRLFAATPPVQLVEADRSKNALGLAPEEISRIENEMGKLAREFKLIERSYGRNVLTLVVYARYVKRLLANAAVLRYLSQHYSDVVAEFYALVDNIDLTQDA